MLLLWTWLESTLFIGLTGQSALTVCAWYLYWYASMHCDAFTASLLYRSPPKVIYDEILTNQAVFDQAGETRSVLITIHLYMYTCLWPSLLIIGKGPL